MLEVSLAVRAVLCWQNRKLCPCKVYSGEYLRESAITMLQHFILKIGLYLFWLLPLPAFAQNIQGITVFGDSYSSTSYITLPGGIVPSSPPYFKGRFSNGSVWVESFSSKFKLPPTAINNFAVGGATTRRGNATLPGLKLQVDRSLKASSSINSSDLFVVWSGSNDYPGNGSAATTIVNNISTSTQRLIDAGAKQVIVANLNDVPLTVTGSQQLVKNPEITQQLTAHNEALNASLQTLTQSNPNLTIFPTDMAALFDAVLANPSRFGWANVDTPCLDALTGKICANPDSYLFWDEAPHPTAAGHRLIADYTLDTLTAQGSIAAQSEIALSAANQQTRDINTRLVELRTLAPKPQRQLNVFASGDANFGSRSTTATNAGFNVDVKGVTVGADYPITNHIALGVAVSAANTNDQLNDNRGKVAIEGTSVSVYGSYTQNRFYSDLLVNYGWNNFKIDRNINVTGFNPATANPSGTQLSFRLNGGYELGSKDLFFGPIAGIRYTNSNIGGYTEQNGDILNLKVNPQFTQSVILNVGAQVAYPFKTSFGKVSPYIAGNFEHEFVQNSRQLVTELLTQPGIPIRTQIAPTDRDFVRLSFGCNTEFTNDLSASLGYETILGKDNFNDNYLHAKIRYQF
jgi:outer membrane lipase/esterase